MDGSSGLATAATVPPFLLFLFLIRHFAKKEEAEDNDKEDDPKFPELNKNKTKVTPKPAAEKNLEQPPMTKKKEVADEKEEALFEKNKRLRATLIIQLWVRKLQLKNKNISDAVKIENVQKKIILKRAAIELHWATTRGTDTFTKVATEELEGYIQGDIDEKIEGLSAEATGDTTGGEITVENEETKAYKSAKDALKIDIKPRGVAQKIRILIGYVQITAALVTSFDIPWPPTFLSLIKGLTVVNFNFMDFLAPISQCDLHTPFLKQAAFHMAILPLCATCILGAAIVAALFQKIHVVRQRAFGLMITLIFLLCE